MIKPENMDITMGGQWTMNSNGVWTKKDAKEANSSIMQEIIIAEKTAAQGTVSIQ